MDLRLIVRCNSHGNFLRRKEKGATINWFSNADQMSGNRTYSNTMHTRRVYTADGVDLITNGVERETWQNKARIPVDEGSEWELNDGAGTITERTIQEDGFLIAESKGDIKTTATDWTVSIRAKGAKLLSVCHR